MNSEYRLSAEIPMRLVFEDADKRQRQKYCKANLQSAWEIVAGNGCIALDVFQFRPASVSVRQTKLAADGQATEAKPQGERAMHRPVAGLRQGRRRERNTAVEKQKKAISRRRRQYCAASAREFGGYEMYRAVSECIRMAISSLDKKL